MGEGDAAENAAARLGEAGYAVDAEQFATRASPDRWRAAYAGLSALAALLIQPLPLAAAALAIAAIVLHARDSDGRPLLQAALSDSSDVVARSQVGPPDLVVVAALAARRRPPRGVVLALQTLMTGTAAAAAIAWVAEVPGSAGAAGVVTAAAVSLVALVLYRPPHTPSGASPAVDVLVDLAQSLSNRRVWLVALGRGDAVQALLERHPELSGATWLNLEARPEGTVVAVSEEGPWRERRPDPWLLDAAEEAGAAVAPERSAPTAAAPLLARRRRALTLLVSAGGASTDVARAVAGAALERVPLSPPG